MNESVLLRVLGVVLSTSGSQITLGVPVALEVAINSNCESIASDVELPIFVQ